jgi:glutaredoxin 3
MFESLHMIEIYTTTTCPYCDRAKDLLRRKGVEFTETDVTHSPDVREKMMQRAGGRRTVPQIFIHDTHVGGCDDLYRLESLGELDPLLTQVK